MTMHKTGISLGLLVFNGLFAAP